MALCHYAIDWALGARGGALLRNVVSARLSAELKGYSGGCRSGVACLAERRRGPLAAALTVRTLLLPERTFILRTPILGNRRGVKIQLSGMGSVETLVKLILVLFRSFVWRLVWGLETYESLWSVAVARSHRFWSQSARYVLPSWVVMMRLKAS